MVEVLQRCFTVRFLAFSIIMPISTIGKNPHFKIKLVVWEWWSARQARQHRRRAGLRFPLARWRLALPTSWPRIRASRRCLIFAGWPEISWLECKVTFGLSVSNPSNRNRGKKKQRAFKRSGFPLRQSVRNYLHPIADIWCRIIYVTRCDALLQIRNILVFSALSWFFFILSKCKKSWYKHGLLK